MGMVMEIFKAGRVIWSVVGDAGMVENTQWTKNSFERSQMTSNKLKAPEGQGSLYRWKVLRGCS
jgi:hypothetical protein